MRPIIPFEYLVIIAAILLAAGGYLAWKTARHARQRDRVAITLLRLAALAGLIAVAFNPGEWLQEREAHPDQWAILIDKSQSMGIADAEGDARLKMAIRIARQATGLIADAGSDVSLYTFANSMNGIRVEDLSNVVADGVTTDILQAGDLLLARHRAGARGLKGVILLSDGCQIGSPGRSDFAIRARSRGTPVYPVVLGGKVDRKDISLMPVRRHYTAFAGQQTKVGATVSTQGFGPVSPVVQLFDGNGKLIDEQKILLEPGSAQRVRFKITPAATGYQEYRMQIAPWESESMAGNNSFRLGITALAEKMRVLFVEGVPFWDTKFAVQLLRRQPNIDISSIYRLSQDRYFRIDTEIEKTSESEQPIFPDDIRELARYDIVIFGKGAEYFLDDKRVALLQAYLRDQGGCVLFARGKAYEGSMPALEVIEPLVWGERLNCQLPLIPTRAGEGAGLFGDLLPAPDNPLWQKMPSLRGVNSCEETKTFSKVLAIGKCNIADRQRTVPMIVSRRYGKGMVAVINAEGLWHWDFFPSADESAQIYKDLWIQIIHWMATYSEYLPGQEYSIQLSRNSILPDESVRVRIGYRGRKESTGNPTVIIHRSDQVEQKIVAAKAGSDQNRWDAVLRFAEPGSYRIGIAEGGADLEIPVYKNVHVRPLPSEMDELSANPNFLKHLADTSGGQLVGPDELEVLLAGQKKNRNIAETNKAVWVPVWDKLWLLLAIAAFFAGEWFLRRRNGLM